jgi:hypothetical protein
MRRVYYFGCRNGQLGHYLYAQAGTLPHNSDHLDGGFPIYLLDGAFAPIDPNDHNWKLTHIRFNHHVLSILACHDNTIDKRPGSNAAFVVIDSAPWNEKSILDVMSEWVPDCTARLKDVGYARCKDVHDES